VLTCPGQINLRLLCIDHRSIRHLINTDADWVLRQITQLGNVPVFLFPLWANDYADRLDKSYPLILGSFSWTLQTSKYFKVPNFLLLDSVAGMRGCLKQKCIHF
jgi:hypothetical protein